MNSSFSIKTTTLATIILFSPLFLSAHSEKKAESESLPLTSFATGGYSVYHLKPATINSSGARVIISAAFDGTVLCHTASGEELWKNQINTDFPFDLAVADINNDGFDESFIATAGGRVYAFKPDGSHLWTFTSTYPLFQVCPVKLAGGDWRILTGGIAKTVYSLSSTGTSLATFAAGNVVRHIRKGNIMGNGNDYAAIATTSTGLTGNLSLILLNPNDMSQVWKKTGLGVSSANSGRRFFSMIIADTDKNGKDNIIVSNSWGDKGLLYGFDETGTQMLTNTTNSNVPGASYRMPLLVNVDVDGTNNDFIFSVFANVLIIYNADGSYNSLIDSKYDFSNGAYDPQTNTFYLGSSPSGGDGIYAFDLGHADWKTAFQQITPVGRLAEVEANLAQLKTQVANFVKPSYQRDPDNVLLITQKPAGTQPDNLLYGSSSTLSQVVIPGELWCKNTDNRQGYNKTQAQIWTEVAQKEANKQNFVLWAGHGKAVYMSPSTMEGILTRAPEYFQGFVFAEMEQTDADMQRIVNEIIFPLAEKCSVAGKKIIFRNKNIFWTGTCYLQFYKDVLLDPRFHDVFVPSLEETNCRTQEMSLAGRVGLWMTGSFDKWAARAVTDNACFDRMWEWSSQQVMSHYLRKMAMRASLGAEIYLIDIHQARFESALREQLVPFYDMLGKGVIAIPEREEVLSVADVCLGMKIPPHSGFLSSGSNGHGYNPSTNSPRVFDRLDAYWGATPLTDYDFSGYGYGAERRMLNFLPKYPYGLVSIVPEDVNISQFSWLKEKIITDGASFYDQYGTSNPATNYKQTVIDKLEASANRLAVRVTGEVAWTVVRLDASHIRVSLFDPGYTDPAKRDATILLQNIAGLKAFDILSGEELSITNQSVSTTVPAGSMRFIDIEHSPTSVEMKPEIKTLSIYPNPTNQEFTLELTRAEGEVTVSISNLAGKTILTEKHYNHSESLKLNYSILSKGFYIVEVRANGSSYHSKIIID
jgi:lambda-carrageenase